MTINLTWILILFPFLKLMGVVDCPWWWIALFYGVPFIFVILFVAFIAAKLRSALKNKRN
jgi:hypothetical protein